MQVHMDEGMRNIGQHIRLHFVHVHGSGIIVRLFAKTDHNVYHDTLCKYFTKH
jgi:hypothetical protein